MAGRGLDDFVEEGDILGACHAVVTIHVVDGEHVVTAGLEVADGELAAVIGTAHAFQRDVGKGCVVKVAVKPHDDVLHRLQVIGTQHDTRYCQGVDDVSCREGKRVSVQLVALVVVLDGVREVDDIGRVLFQRITELDGHFLADGADHRL